MGEPMVPPWAPSFCARRGFSLCASRAGKLAFGGGVAATPRWELSFVGAVLTESVGERGLRPGPQLLGVRTRPELCASHRSIEHAAHLVISG